MNKPELPKDPVVYNSWGARVYEQNDLDSAIKLFRRAVELGDDFADAHTNLGICLMASGDLAAGFEEFEWRYHPKFTNRDKPTAPPGDIPRWQGEPLSGKALLVFQEQGFGDTIQFVRYLRVLKDQGVRIYLYVRPPLYELMKSLDAVDVLLTDGHQYQRALIDYWVAPLSLPHFIRRSSGQTAVAIDLKADQIPYLAVPDELSASWGEWLNQTQAALGTSNKKTKIGLVWAGRPTHPNDKRRSIALSDFAVLGDLADVQFVSAQFGEHGLAHVQAPAGLSIIDAGARIENMADMAALLQHLDLLITIDSAPAHLAGALGIPTWVLIPHRPDWRWGLGGEVSHWYPSLRLFRQGKAEPWSGVTARMRHTLLNPVPLLPWRTGVSVQTLWQQACALQVAKQYEQARDVFDYLLLRQPGYADAWVNQGCTLVELGRSRQAREYFRRALSINPAHVLARFNLAVLIADEAPVLALDEYRQILSYDPNQYKAWYNQANLLQAQHDAVAAEASFRRALELAPDFVDAYNNFGNLLRDLGRFTEADSLYAKALQHQPDYMSAFSNRLFTANYRADLTLDQWFGLYQDYALQFEAPLRPSWPEHQNDRDLTRRLRVGYVSADFKDHSVAKFLEPVLAQHDRNQVEVVCFSADAMQDMVTLRFKQLANRWHDVAALSDVQMCDLVQKEAIDILVDLSGHTLGNRLLVFARKPAPVQMTWLGYGATTGLTAIDYFLCDPRMVPPEFAPYCSEQLLYLPVIAPFTAPDNSPDVNELPTLARPVFSFGSLARTSRINDEVIAVWSALLKVVPESQLILDQRPFQDPVTCEDYWRRFEAQGIARKRLVLRCSKPYWNAYHDIDVALDPFPHNAGTTTYEALWMGVPVISLRDRPPMGRFGDSILSAVGLNDWVVDTKDAYIERAVIAARDLGDLSALRLNLRKRLIASPLMDGKGFTRALEQRYREAWQTWCDGTVEVTKAAVVKSKSKAKLGKDKTARTVKPAETNLVASQKKLLASIDDPLRLKAWQQKFQNGQYDSLAQEVAGALQLNPNDANALHMRALCSMMWGRPAEAIPDLRRAAELMPRNPEVWDHLGVALNRTGQSQQAHQAYLKGMPLNTNRADIWNNACKNATSLYRHDLAIEYGERAVTIRPNFYTAWNNLGMAYAGANQLQKAEAAYRQVFKLAPDYAEAHNNLANLLKDWGRFAEAEVCYAEALRYKPDYAIAFSNRLFTCNYRSDLTLDAWFALYQEFSHRFEEPLKLNWPRHLNDRNPDRRLRVGYVSGDFREHAVAKFLEPVLAQHDRRQIELVLFNTSPAFDAATPRFKALADQWFDLMALTDEQAAAFVVNQKIDILIDLSGHTFGNRLLMFARKPAPVQMTWLGYGTTTGLKAIDYFLCDARMVPPEFASYCSEKPRYLPVIAPFTAPQDTPSVNALPAEHPDSAGCFTFGSLARTSRMSEGVLNTWATLLKAVPHARLVLDQRPFQDAVTCEDYWRRFESLGIERQRVVLRCSKPHWNAYADIDVALDPFPHNAGTTTYEALWMGVPVVSLRDRPPMGRFGDAILSAVGMADWVVDTPAAYVQRGVKAAHEITDLAHLRRELRARLLASPLMDAPGFTRALEANLRDAWQQWCSAAPD